MQLDSSPTGLGIQYSLGNFSAFGPQVFSERVVKMYKQTMSLQKKYFFFFSHMVLQGQKFGFVHLSKGGLLLFFLHLYISA